MTPTFVTSIPHAPWLAGRAESLKRLWAQLDLAAHEATIFAEKEPCAAWSERVWESFEKSEATHGLQLQDDVRLAPNFWPALTAICTAYPDSLIALHSFHTAGRTLARSGIHAYTSNDGLVATGYVVPKSAQGDFRAWRRHELKPGSRETLTDDTVLAMFAISTNRRIVSPVPTIIDHDTSIASSAGAVRESQPWRRPSVTWEDLDVLGLEPADLEKPDFWCGAVHLGTVYTATHAACLAHCKSFTVSDLTRAAKDVAEPKYLRFLRPSA